MDNLPQLMNRVLELQPSWHKYSSTQRFQSEEIIERGTLVTKEAPKLLDSLVSSEKICSVSRYNNWKSNGSNGSGNIAKIGFIASMLSVVLSLYIYFVSEDQMLGIFVGLWAPTLILAAKEVQEMTGK